MLYAHVFHSRQWSNYNTLHYRAGHYVRDMVVFVCDVKWKMTSHVRRRRRLVSMVSAVLVKWSSGTLVAPALGVYVICWCSFSCCLVDTRRTHDNSEYTPSPTTELTYFNCVLEVGLQLLTDF